MNINDIEWKPVPQPEPGEEEHLNCFQKTLMPNCDILGIDEQEAKRMGSYFGGGMRAGYTCGPVNAALILLGQMYGDSKEAEDLGKEFLIEFSKANGTDSFLCSDIRDEEHIRCAAAIEWTLDYIAKHRK